MSMWSGARVLVTGGAGFVGSHLVEKLCQLGARVRVADNLSTGRLEHLQNVRGDVEFLELDLRDPEAAHRAVVGQQIVLNLAGWIAGIGYNSGRQTEFFANNVALQQAPLLAARDAGIERFCQVSSACVYPADAPVPTPESAADEGPPEISNQGYGWGKRMGEELARYVAAESELPIAVVRFFNVYGPRDHADPSRSHVIPALIQRCLDDPHQVTVWGSGKQTRSFVYVTDIVDLILETTERYACADPINLGTPSEITIAELITLITEILSIEPEVIFDTSKPEGYARRAPDLTKLYRVLGRVPEPVPFRFGLERVVDYYRSMRVASA